MVVFACNHCGEALKKQAVEKHSFKCSRNIFVSCMDCQKDFKGKEYDEHIKCISELEKYSGKDFVPKPNQNKGAKKQEAWVEMVRHIQATKAGISQSVNKVLTTISQYDNIPRKKASFIRFMQNSFRYMKMQDIEAAWGLLEEEIQKNKPQTNGNSVPAQNGAQKRKLEENEKIEPKPETKKQKVEETTILAEFDWTKTMKDILMSKDNQVKLKKLKKKVFKKYKDYYNVSSITEKFEKKFLKRMKKLGLVVEDDTVRLIQ